MDAYVYVAGTMDGPKKIGVSARPSSRIKGVTTPQDYEAQAVLLGERLVPHSMAYAIEQATHRMLWDNRLGHEWFTVDLAEALRLIDIAADLVETAVDGWGGLERATPGETWRHVVRSLRPNPIGKAGAKPRHPDAAVLAAAKLGVAKGAAKLGYSVTGFLKAIERVKRTQEAATP